MGVIPEKKGNVDQVETLGEIGEIARAAQIKIEIARTHGGQHGRTGAENAVGIKLDADGAVGAAFDQFGEFGGGEELRIGARGLKAETQHNLFARPAVSPCACQKYSRDDDQPVHCLSLPAAGAGTEYGWTLCPEKSADNGREDKMALKITCCPARRGDSVFFKRFPRYAVMR